MVQGRLLIDGVGRSGVLLNPPHGRWEIEQNAFGHLGTILVSG